MTLRGLLLLLLLISWVGCTLQVNPTELPCERDSHCLSGYVCALSGEGTGQCSEEIIADDDDAVDDDDAANDDDVADDDDAADDDDLMDDGDGSVHGGLIGVVIDTYVCWEEGLGCWNCSIRYDVTNGTDPPPECSDCDLRLSAVFQLAADGCTSSSATDGWGSLGQSFVAYFAVDWSDGKLSSWSDSTWEEYATGEVSSQDFVGANSEASPWGMTYAGERRDRAVELSWD